MLLDEKEKIESKNWFHRTFDNFLKFNRIFQVSTVLAAFWFSYQTKKQSVEIEALTVTNAYLLAESSSDSKAINESPFPWWKKEYDPETEIIIMRSYNDSFYHYFLEGLGVDRFYYVRKSDFAVFPFEDANMFYKEDIELIREFMVQEPLKNGLRSMMIKEYDNNFTDLNGDLNKDGYWRYVREEEGHVYIYGRMKKPRIPKNKTL